MYKKILTALLAGALVLGATSCKDYDDDIDDLNARIDNLESVTIADISSQITSIQSSISSLESSLSSSVSSLTSQIESVSDDVDDLESSMASQLAALESTLKAYVDGEIDDVEAAIATLQSSLSNYYTKEEAQSTVNSLLLEYYTKTEIDAMFATISTSVSTEVSAREAAITELQSQITALQSTIEDLQAEINEATGGDISALEEAIAEAEDTIAALEAQIEENEAAIETLTTSLEELAAEFDEFVAGLETWFGEQFSKYISNYITYDYLVKYVSGVAVALYEQILAEIQTEGSSYYEAIMDIVTSVTDEIQDQLDKLEAAFYEYQAEVDEALADFEERITKLETRIQSLAYVPAYTSGKVYFQGRQYITDADGNEFDLYNPASNPSTASVTFRITPIALADSIANGNGGWTYDIISNTASVKSSDYLTITGVTAGSNGYITFDIESTYTFEGSETLVFAICFENSDADASYTSDYITTASLYQTGDVTSNFSLGYAGTSSIYTVEDGYALETGTLSKESGSYINLFAICAIFYVEGGVAYSLSDAGDAFGWTNVPTEVDTVTATKSHDGLALDFSDKALDYTESHWYGSCSSNYTLSGKTLTVVSGDSNDTINATCVFSIVEDSITYISFTATQTVKIE